MHSPLLKTASQHVNKVDKLIDQFGRTFTYLRIGVNEQCNLRCLYCMPEKGIRFNKNSNLLRGDEIIRVIKNVADLGVNKVRFTGGEPLLNKEIIKIITETIEIDRIKSTHLTTNGMFLGEKLKELKNAKLNGVNISLDTLDHKKFEKITRRSGIETVINSIYQAVDIGIPDVKINVVMMRGINDNEISDFAELTRNAPITIRFIELMPFDSQQIWKTGHFYGIDFGIKKLEKKYDSLLPTIGSSTEHRVFKINGYKGKIAFIPSYTRNMCGTCNRIRVTADGKLRNCLYSEREFDVLELLRTDASDTQIKAFFQYAMLSKLKDGWAAQHEQSITLRKSMTQIGG